MTEGPSDGRNREADRLFGAPEPENFRETPEGRALAASAQIHFTDKLEQDRLLAVEKVALDILNDPLAARAFAVNPQEYLRRAGFEGIELRLDSPEVRVAMALGDPEVRKAAQRGDIEGFLDGIRRQGLPTDEPTMAVAAFEIAAVMSAAAVTWAAVTFSVVAGMMVAAAAGFVTKVAAATTVALGVEDYTRMIRGLVEEIRGTPEFATAVDERILQDVIEKYARLHAAAPELLQGDDDNAPGPEA